jgi:hypothetical protein
MKKSIGIIFSALLSLALLLTACSESKFQSEKVDKQSVDTVDYSDSIKIQLNDTLQHSYLEIAPQYAMYEEKEKQVFVFHPYVIKRNALREPIRVRQNYIRNNC